MEGVGSQSSAWSSQNKKIQLSFNRTSPYQGIQPMGKCLDKIFIYLLMRNDEF